MLLRLRIKGFKNLRNVDVRFGPLTCFVGPNGVGKSNIFDAIQFLRYLADDEFQRAAERVRGPAAGAYSPLELFWANDASGKIELSADMLVPTKTIDDFGSEVLPTISSLRYTVHFGYAPKPRPRLVLEFEELAPLKRGVARALIGFDHSPQFRTSVVTGRRAGGAFISTQNEGDALEINLHGDGGSRGRPAPAAPSPRTVLAGTGAGGQFGYPTVVAARREMSSWHALHLEPSSLRTPDRFGDPDSVDELGRHIAATLVRLAKHDAVEGMACAEVSNRLARLVPDVEAVRVDRDEIREQLVVQAKMRGSPTWLSPRSISDGTLRFLALVTMQMDSNSPRVLCMEEPENGIEPSRIPALMQLLRDYVVDPALAVDGDNALRQMIVNSHSPDVVRQLDVPQLLFVDSVHGPAGREAAVRPIDAPGNWRDSDGCVEIGALVRFVGGSPVSEELSQRQLKFAFGSAT